MPKREKINEENHKPRWREVAHDPTTGKKIYFCACMGKGNYSEGCGAVAIKQTRTSSIIMVKGSRFE